MPTDHPNVLLLLSDEHSARFQGRVGGHGEPARTPTIDDLAATGTDFEEAYCRVPLCGPSRDCLLTSRDQRTCGSWINEDVLDPSLPTLPGTFSATGYETCLVGKMHFAGEYQFYGFDHRPYGDLTGGTGHQWEPLDPDERASLWENAGITGVPESQLQEHRVVRESLAWLREHEARSDAPWLLCASFSRPHFPLTAPRRYVDRFWDLPRGEPTDRFTDPPVGVRADTVDHPMVRAVRERAGGEDVDERTRRFARACYFACVAFLDDVLGEFLALAERDGLLDDAIVVYTSDHGELAGEHGLWGKKTWHEASTRVPLVVATPDQRRGVNDAHRIETPVSLADLFPTLCGLCGVETPVGLDGTDLAGRLDVRTATEVLPAILDVEGDGLGAGGLLLEDVPLVGVVRVGLKRLLEGALDTLDVVVGIDDVVHLRLDVLEVVGVEVDAGDVVVEALLGRRADGQFGLGVEPLERLREHVRGGVPQRLQVLLGVLGDDDEIAVRLQRLLPAGEVAVDDPADRVLAEARSDFVGHVLDRRPRLHLELGAVRQRDDDVAHAYDKPRRGDKY